MLSPYGHPGWGILLDPGMKLKMLVVDPGKNTVELHAQKSTVLSPSLKGLQKGTPNVLSQKSSIITGPFGP
ncbi:unnamed protein product [Merluccius merluccius]